MNKTGAVLVAGAAFYVAIAFWQSVINPAIIPEAGAIAVLLGGFSSLLAVKNPEMIKKGEIISIWICILLFAVYGILKIGGLL